jgi:hypothetical protein
MLWEGVEVKRENEKGFFLLSPVILIFVTGDFTAEGKECVKDKPIELVDGLKLEKLAQ